MSLSNLLNHKPDFYASIASFLPLEDQLRLVRVNTKCKNLVDCANMLDFNALKVSRVYENCKEQIDQLNGPWHVKKEAKNIIPYAIPIIDQDLKNSCQSLGLKEASRFSPDSPFGPLSIAERVKIAKLIDNKNDVNLIRFFQKLLLAPAQRQLVGSNLSGCKTDQEQARYIREWMQANTDALSHITKLEQIGGEAFYFGTSHFMPAEVLLLNGLEQSDLFIITRKSLKHKSPALISKIIKDPRLLEMSAGWLGKLLVHAASGESLCFIKALMDSEKFADIPHESLEKAFEAVAQSQNVEIINAFLSHTRFSEISGETIGKSLIAAAVLRSTSIENAMTHVKNRERLIADIEQKSLNFIKTLIQSSRFELIDPASLAKAIEELARTGGHGIVETLLQTRGALFITYDDLKSIFETSDSYGMLQSMHIFFKCYGKKQEKIVSSSSRDSSALEPDPTLEFIKRAIRAIYAVKADNDDNEDYDEDSSSESDVEMDYKENIAQSPVGRKRAAEDLKDDASDNKRRRAVFGDIGNT